MSLKNVTLVGASGNVGTFVLPELAKSGLNITVVTRGASSKKFPENIKVVSSDFSLASLTEIFKGQDAVVSMIPIIALEGQAVVIEAAIAAGVKRFLPSEYGSDSSNPAVAVALPFLKEKAEYLNLLKSKQDVISWTALITGPFFDWGFWIGMHGFDLATKTATIVDGGKTPFTTSTNAQIARSLVAVLTHPVETANKAVFVESFTTNQLEILSALENAIGEKWSVIDKQSDEMTSSGFKEMAEGNLLEGGAKLIKAFALGTGALEDHSVVEGGIWNDVLGLPKENVVDAVKNLLAIAGSQK